MDGRYTSSIWYTEDPRKEVARVIWRCKGNLLKAAFHIGIHRSHLYRLINQYRLWPLINHVRKKAVVEKFRRKIVRGVYV